MAERLGDMTTISWVDMASGVFEMGKCGWTTSGTHFRRSMQVADQFGERKNWETSMSSLGNLKRVEGLFEPAKACSDATLAPARDRISAIPSPGRKWPPARSDVPEPAGQSPHGLPHSERPQEKGDTNDNSNVVDGYARSRLALVDGDLTKARAGLNDAIAVVRGMSRP